MGVFRARRRSIWPTPNRRKWISFKLALTAIHSLHRILDTRPGYGWDFPRESRRGGSLGTKGRHVGGFLQCQSKAAGCCNPNFGWKHFLTQRERRFSAGASVEERDSRSKCQQEGYVSTQEQRQYPVVDADGRRV